MKDFLKKQLAALKDKLRRSDDKENRRRLRNYFVPGSGQAFYGWSFAALSSAGILGLGIAFIVFSASSEVLPCQGNSPLCAPTNGFSLSDLNAILPMLLGVLAIVGITGLMLGIVASHRTFGPLVQIRRHIEALLEEDYTSRIKLRDKDQFRDIADLLNRLAENLDDTPQDKPSKKKKH